jgi:hypothetical protein
LGGRTPLLWRRVALRPHSPSQRQDRTPP